MRERGELELQRDLSHLQEMNLGSEYKPPCRNASLHFSIRAIAVHLFELTLIEILDVFHRFNHVLQFYQIYVNSSRSISLKLGPNEEERTKFLEDTALIFGTTSSLS